MLEFDPRRRISVEDALQHPWLSQLHDPAAEPSAPSKSPLTWWVCSMIGMPAPTSINCSCCRAGPFTFKFEEEELNEATVRKHMWNEMLYYNN